MRTAAIERRDLRRSIRTVGILAHNDEKVVSVNTKFEGWIERAAVNNVGESVQQGDVLFEIYSPELVTTQQEYLAAMDYLKRLREGGAHADAVGRAESLLEATRERLRHWDVTEAQIAALAAAGQASRTLPFLAPTSGFVVAKMGDSLDGMKLSPGMTVLKIADHSALWVEVQLYEEDVRHVHEGSPVSIEVEAFPERRWNGRIRFFRSAVSAQTRTLTAFVEIANPDLALRPMMYVNVAIEAEGVRDAIVAPAESVLRSGTRSVVIVDRGAGVFEPREVALGLADDGLQEITAGLAAGERVLVSSQFLIDSESNLQAATAQLLRGTGETGDSAASNDAGPITSHHAHH
ncbi:MAG: efflux RND transporter periplasmic adaptor subunit [Gammaproteobacteria bacterium]|nr:efflux RND transporter periplasmic adaptor subunit [Gammaproteobacteria bacterium]